MLDPKIRLPALSGRAGNPDAAGGGCQGNPTPGGL